MARLCKVVDCQKPVRARGWCRNHYNLWHRHKEDPAGRERRPQGNCCVCGEPAEKRSMCRRHYRRWLTHGGPDARYGEPLVVERIYFPNRALLGSGGAVGHVQSWVTMKTGEKVLAAACSFAKSLDPRAVDILRPCGTCLEIVRRHDLI